MGSALRASCSRRQGSLLCLDLGCSGSEGGRVDPAPGDRFHLAHERLYLAYEELAGGGGLGLWHFHYVGGMVLGKDLEHLLLAVAGGLAHDEIRALNIRARAVQLESERGADQRAGVARDQALAVGNREVCPGAQSHRHSARREDDLLRHVDAERAHDSPAGFLVLDELLNAQAVGLADDEIEILHPFRAVGLGHIDLRIRAAQQFEQGIVAVEVEAKTRPHGSVV